MAQFPLFTPLAGSLLTPLPFPFTYLESLFLRDAIPSTLAQVARKLTSPSPFPPHSKFPAPQVDCAP